MKVHGALARSAGLASLVLAFTQDMGAQAPITHQIQLQTGMSWCEDTRIHGLFSEINRFRIQNGLQALVMDGLGMKDAEMRAAQFAVYMTTTPPGSPGFNPHEGWDTTAASLGYPVISENLAYMTTDPINIVYSVWQGDLHRAAMLASDATVAGVSCVYYNGTAYWTYEPGRTGSGGGSPSPAPSPSPSPAPTPGSPTVEAEEWTFLDLINNYRAQNGAGPLQISAALQSAAEWMSNDMATNHYASHTDSQGRSVGARLAAFGYPYYPAGENIAGGWGDPQTALDQWANACDPDASGQCTYAHRVNMLNAAYKVIGIGRVYNANSQYGWYWTTDFGGVVDQTISPPGTPDPTPTPTVTISSFTANPATISAGQSAVLSWNVTGATSLSLDNGIGAVTNTTSRTVSPASTTTYRLTATNGSVSVSALVTVTVTAAPAVDQQPPTAPLLTSAVARGQNQVDLTWTGSSDNVGVAGYRVMRNGAPLANVAPAARGYSDYSASANTTYSYAVRAFDAAGNWSADSNAMSVSTPAPPVASSCPAAATGAFTGCYYNNLDLTGTPVMVRTDSQINFDWTWAPPSPSLSSQGYSVRWQGIFNFAGGVTTFTAVTSDGMRIYIDGNVILDRWRDQPVYFYTLRPTLSAGNHLITVEYYERTGTATAQLSWQGSGSPSGQPPSIASFTATPAAISAGQSANLSWSVSGATSISIDNGVGDVSSLSAKAVSPLQTTTYRLTAANSGGTASALVTVSVTAGPAPDTQSPSTPALNSAIAKGPTQVDLAWTGSTDNVGVAGYQILRNGNPLVQLAAGARSYSDQAAAPGAAYSYSVKAFDLAGNYSAASNAIQVTTPPAAASSSCVPANGAFTGCYYSNTDLAGTPVLIRTDSQINFDWMFSSPASTVPASNYSVRWQGNFYFDQGVYTFSAITSDGMRIYIDGNLILDRWRDQPVYMYKVRPTLTQGTHLVTVEYYARSGSATARLSWQKD